MDNKEKYIAKAKGGNTRRLAKTGTKLRLGATKRGIGPAGGAPVSKATGEVFTGQGKEVPTSDLPQSGQITMQGNKKSQNRIK